MNIQEKVAYLKGLVNGLELNETKEAKVIMEITDLLEDIAFAISELQDGYGELSEIVSEIDEDLGDIEEKLYGDYEDIDFIEAECENCGEIFDIDMESISNGSINCPECGEELEIDFPDFEEEDILNNCPEDCDCKK